MDQSAADHRHHAAAVAGHGCGGPLVRSAGCPFWQLASHEQLAAGYKNLDLPEQEIAEIEILLKLKPQDKEILFRLGILCFQQGQNARGLQIYEELKQANYKKSSDLICFYGNYPSFP